MPNNFKNKVVVVTGGTGYIGAKLIQNLVGNTKKLICVSRKKIKSINGVENWKLDLCSYSSWKKIILEADVVFHMASNTSIYDAEKNPSANLMDNLFPITLLIQASKDLCRTPKVIFASTATVYGSTDVLPVTEKAHPNPVTFYCLHKQIAEKELTMATQNKIIDGISLRLANVYGPSLNESKSQDRGILNKITKMAVAGQNLNIYGNGNCVRDYIYIDDVISAFIHASLTDLNETVFNISSGFGISLKDIFLLVSKKILNLNGKKIHINHIDWPENIDEIEKRNFVGSNELFISKSRWYPTVSLDQGIDLLINFYTKEMHNETS
jgi:UDP-glucose 4-epimerase